MDNKDKVSVYKVINYAGAFIALLIGSGFATGQEVLQFFASRGIWGVAGAILTFLMLAYVGVSFVSTGYRERFENGNDIYKYYCGNVLGTFFDYFSIFFIFLSITVMVGGASATGQQHYGWTPVVGGVLIGILAIVTVLFGLNKIVDIIGNIGPAIVVLALFVSIVTILANFNSIFNSSSIIEEAVNKGEIIQAGNVFGMSNWVLSVGAYVGFCMLWLAAFLGQVGKNSKNFKEVRTGAFSGALGFSLAVLFMTLALISQIASIKGSSIPALILAGEINPLFATIFSITIFLGIYTTAVPLLWTVVARFFKEKTTNFYIATVVVGVVAMFIGLSFDFKKLVNIVYEINGYLGLLLFFIMVFISVRDKRI